MCEESESESFIESASRVLLRTILAFKPFTPTAITLLVNQQLYTYKESGAISEHKTKTKRFVKFHYRIETDSDLTGMQAVHRLANLFPKQLSCFQEVVS